MEHWMEQEIAQCVHHEVSIRQLITLWADTKLFEQEPIDPIEILRQYLYRSITDHFVLGYQLTSINSSINIKNIFQRVGQKDNMSLSVFNLLFLIWIYLQKTGIICIYLKYNSLINLGIRVTYLDHDIEHCTRIGYGDIWFLWVGRFDDIVFWECRW